MSKRVLLYTFTVRVGNFSSETWLSWKIVKTQIIDFQLVRIIHFIMKAILDHICRFRISMGSADLILNPLSTLHYFCFCLLTFCKYFIMEVCKRVQKQRGQSNEPQVLSTQLQQWPTHGTPPPSSYHGVILNIPPGIILFQLYASLRDKDFFFLKKR